MDAEEDFLEELMVQRSRTNADFPAMVETALRQRERCRAAALPSSGPTEADDAATDG